MFDFQVIVHGFMGQTKGDLIIITYYLYNLGHQISSPLIWFPQTRFKVKKKISLVQTAFVIHTTMFGTILPPSIFSAYKNFV